MKKSFQKILLAAAVVIFTTACSQKNQTIKENDAKSDKSLIVKSDSLAEMAAKKKASEEEKAKLPKPYHPAEKAELKIKESIGKAKKEHKYVMIQAGGNWCIWCLRFNNFVQTTPELKDFVDKNFIYYHLNWSPENKNEAIFSKYGNPGDKFGYPVFIVLDQNGKMIHVQDSAVLEEGKGYSKGKVLEFFKTWAPKQ